MTGDQIRHARRAGRLHQVYPAGYGVYSAVPVELLQDDAPLMAAVLALRGKAVVGHRSAAFRHRLLQTAPRTHELISMLEFRPPPGIEVRRTHLRVGDVEQVGRFRMTTVERTLLDLATLIPAWSLDRALREAEFHHDRRPADIAAVLRRGHPGSAALRAALERHVPGWGEMRSRLERRFRELLVTHGVALPLRNHKVGPWNADCFWPALKVIVELDGGQHERPGQAKVDADRDLWLRQNGYVTRRYTWDQVTRRGSAVVADLHAAFAESALLRTL